MVGREEVDVVSRRRGEWCVADWKVEKVGWIARRDRDGYRKGIIVSTTTNAREGAIEQAEKTELKSMVGLKWWWW